MLRSVLIVGPVDSVDGSPADITLLRDRDYVTHKTYGANASGLVLVRPDGYIGFRSALADPATVIDYLAKNFGLGAPDAAPATRPA